MLLDEFSAMPVQTVKYPDQYALKARRMLEAYDSSAEEWILSPLKALAADALCEEHSLRYVRDYIVPLLPSLKDGLVFSTIEQLCQLLQEAIDAYMTAGASSAAERKMHKAKAYIQAHFDTDIYTALVAEAVGVSESSLRSNYRECFGITPKQEILQLRIEKAKHLLDEGSLPVGQIALACGFQSLQHFSRQFAKSTGVPPTAFSKRKEVDK